MPKADDLYAPPSSEELADAKKAQEDLFAPPTKEELGAAKAAQEDALYQNNNNPIIQLAVAGAKAFDSYTGAPARAGIGAAQDVGSLNPVDWVKAGGSGFAKQFGGDPDQAPTGEDIVKKAGVPEGIPSKAAGFAMDMAANPVNFVGPISSLLGKTVNAAREIPVVGDAFGAAVDFPGRVASKVVEKATHLPNKAVKIYSSDPSAVNSFIENTGGELSAGADEMKQSIVDAIQAKKNQVNDQIKGALAQADPDHLVPSQPILDQLEKVKVNINKHTDPAAFQHIQNQIQTIKNVSPSGQMSLQDLYDAKNYLQNQRYGTLKQPNGDLFLVHDDARRAAGNALEVARKTLHEQAPAIKEADQFFSQLHEIDNNMSSGLLGKGKSEDMFASAGGATNKHANQHYTALKKIDDLVGTHAVDDAEIVYAAKALNKSPSIMKEGFKTGATLGQNVSNSIIPARTYNATQAIGVPDSPLQRKKTAIQRRLGSDR